VADAIREWLLQQLHASDTLQGVAVVIKVAVAEFGSKPVAQELRKIARHLERTGEVPGWKFPVGSVKTKSRARSAA
jgi:hypothetical protein